MFPSRRVSRRRFLQSVTLASAAGVVPILRTSALAFGRGASNPIQSPPLEEFSYGDVTLDSALHEQQLQQTHAVLMELSDDALLKPFRQMIGQPAPGEDLGGWYRYDPNYDWHTFDAIGIGAAVTHRPLPHHRAYGSVHGGSIGYASNPRLTTEDRGTGSRRSTARPRELWTGPNTTDHHRCRQC